jgi:hypothetical protein
MSVMFPQSFHGAFPSKEWALDLRETFHGPRGQLKSFGAQHSYPLYKAGDQVRIGHSGA